MEKEDNIFLKCSNRYIYASGRIIGLPLDLNNNMLYYGFDGELGELEAFGGSHLTKEELREISVLMIQKWTAFLERLSK